VQCQIQQADNPMPTVVIRLNAVPPHYVIFVDYMSSEVAPDELKVGSTDPYILIENNCTYHELHFGMPGGSRDYTDEGDESDELDVIPSTSRRLWAATELKRFDLGTNEVKQNQGGDAYNDYADEEEDAARTDAGSTQIVEEWGHSTRDREDSKVYYRPVKCDNGEANVMACDGPDMKTVSKLVTISQSKTYTGRVRRPIYSNSGEQKCGTRPEKGINIARHYVISYSITAAPAKSVTHLPFSCCVYTTTFQVQSKGGRYAT